MDRHAVAGEAWLLKDGTKIPIQARYGSKFSIWVRFPDGTSYPNGTSFDCLMLKIGDEKHELGRSKLLWETNIEGYAGRLVLSEHFGDFESIFFDRKPVTLESAFYNVQLLLNHKKSIRDEFKDFVADLAYDLSVYESAFDALESEYRDEPDPVKVAILDVVFKSEGSRLREYLDERQAELVRLVEGLGKTEGQRHGFYFRKQLWNILLLVPIMARTNLKPRGYAGDSEMMRMLYSQEYEGETTFAKVLHKHAIDQPAAEAVRNRRNTIARWFDSQFEGEPVRMLSVACGPAYELVDILRRPAVAENLATTLFDQDQYALLEAARRVDDLERDIGKRVSVEYLRESVRTMLVAPRLRDRWGKFDLIYSMGLFDYLTPPVAKAVLARLFQLLNPGGEMMIGNFHVNNPNRRFMEYWLDWVIYHRTEEEFEALASDIPAEETSIELDSTGIQMFLRIRKGSE
jgi:extracellular factor (EF) 3-hydroxypalmitic acid methyl ester biosynthesis protein